MQVFRVNQLHFYCTVLCSLALLLSFPFISISTYFAIKGVGSDILVTIISPLSELSSCRYHKCCYRW